MHKYCRYLSGLIIYRLDSRRYNIIHLSLTIPDGRHPSISTSQVLYYVKTNESSKCTKTIGSKYFLSKCKQFS